MREIRLSGSEGGGPNPIVSPYPYCYFAPLGLKDGCRRYPQIGDMGLGFLKIAGFHPAPAGQSTPA